MQDRPKHLISVHLDFKTQERNIPNIAVTPAKSDKRKPSENSFGIIFKIHTKDKKKKISSVISHIYNKAKRCPKDASSLDERYYQTNY